MFDFVYMRRPYIFYIPDLDDPEIEVIYKNEYFEFYNNIKNGTIKFENLVFNVEDLLDKIVFYINNDFTLDDNIKNFYDSFDIKKGDNINDMINYLVKLK
jgi:CDP-glycerol glycerophosphotransferase (TagB/SpsB family)